MASRLALPGMPLQVRDPCPRRRKLGQNRTTAKVIAMRQPAKPRLEVGVIEDGSGIYVETTARYRMTDKQAEELAANLMQFVHELRNGGVLT